MAEHALRVSASRDPATSTATRGGAERAVTASSMHGATETRGGALAERAVPASRDSGASQRLLQAGAGAGFSLAETARYVPRYSRSEYHCRQDYPMFRTAVSCHSDAPIQKAL